VVQEILQDKIFLDMSGNLQTSENDGYNPDVLNSLSADD